MSSVCHWLKWKGLRLYARMVRERKPPEFIARGWALGIFVGCAVPFGFQLVVSVPLSFFLKCSKVGAVVGTLIEVGRGKRSEESFGELLLEALPDREKSVMRSCAGESVPGHALFLSDIEYASGKYQK